MSGERGPSLRTACPKSYSVTYGRVSVTNVYLQSVINTNYTCEFVLGAHYDRPTHTNFVNHDQYTSYHALGSVRYDSCHEFVSDCILLGGEGAVTTTTSTISTTITITSLISSVQSSSKLLLSQCVTY